MGLLGAWRPWAEIESVAETASRIGVSDQTIRNWAKERPDLLVERDGHTAVRRDEVQAFIRSNKRLMKLCGPHLARQAERAEQFRNAVAAAETKPQQPGAGAWKTVHFAAPTALVDEFWSVVKARGGSAIKTLEAALAALRGDGALAEAQEEDQRAARKRYHQRKWARRMERPEDDKPSVGKVISTREEWLEMMERRREKRRRAKEEKAAQLLSANAKTTPAS